MPIKNKLKAKEEMVEKMGVFFEQRGLSPIHGRVFAYLLLEEPPYKDFYQIQDFLKASKGSISNALKFLMDKGLVKYLTFSGDRKRYFQVDMDGWMAANIEQARRTPDMIQYSKDLMEMRSGSKFLEFNEQLEKILDFHKQLGDVMEQFIEKWMKENR